MVMISISRLVFFFFYITLKLGKGFLAQVSTGFTCTPACRWLVKRIVSGVSGAFLSLLVAV